MSKIIAFIDLKLCDKELKVKVKKLCEAGVNAVVFRAKELSEDEYERLFKRVLKVCDKFGVKLYLHNFLNLALRLKYKLIWLPLCVLRGLSKEDTNKFTKIVASTHSQNEAKEALKFGANSLCVSHIFTTSCKDSSPKGVGLIKSVREIFKGELYALGGVDFTNYKECLNAGADAVCLMSSVMKCENENEYLAKFKN